MLPQKQKPPRRRPGRIPVSCAECRRLKLKCDHKIPCETCTKRGCASICPDGTLSSGKRKRLMLANTEELHEHIDALVGRIRQLEDGLANVQAHVSNEKHPLLRSDLLQIKTAGPSTTGAASTSASGSESRRRSPQPQSRSPTTSESLKEEEIDIIDSFGTLHIGPHGDTHYLGKTARPDHLLSISKASHYSSRSLPRLSPEILHASSFGNDYCPVQESVKQSIYNLLPPIHEAYELCDMYVEHSPVFWDGISRSRLVDEIVPSVYNSGWDDAFLTPHDLSLLFLVLSLACLFDLSRSPNSIEAEEYYVLARAAANCAPIFGNPTLTGVECLLHMGFYLEYSTRNNRSWIMFSMSANLAQSLGLHLSPARWKLDEELSERRRRLFWNVYLADSTTALMLGRPPVINLAASDCELPRDTENSMHLDTQLEVGFRHWFYRYTELMALMHKTFGPKPPAYATILELDRRIRDFPVPQNYSYAHTLEPQSVSSTRVRIQGWYILCAKELALLHLHRSYLVSSLSVSPNSPSSPYSSEPSPSSSHSQLPSQTNSPAPTLNAKFRPSVVAAYRSARNIIHGLQRAWEVLPDRFVRPEMSDAWGPAVSSAIVMAFLVTRAPATDLAAPALGELEMVYSVLSEASRKGSSTAEDCLVIVSKLLNKSRTFADWYSVYGHSSNPSQTPSAANWIEDLDQLSGKTHLAVEDVAPSPRSSSHGREDSPEALHPHPAIAGGLPLLGLSSYGHHYFQPERQYTTFAESSARDELMLSGPGMPGGRADDTSDSEETLVEGASMRTYSGLFPRASSASDGPVLLDPAWQAFMQQLGF